ncbi:4-hydroxy-tetrahydrodipicolinate reductase [Azonexus sp.]|uniref:4-hydroxy-tetrahydrodipicolinate reductase n=1 Tax=Azonexus sp. TaxID=1872668 RepID=UPI0039E6D4D8
MIRLGLIGYGKAGAAVACVLKDDPRFDLRWIARRSAQPVEENCRSIALNINTFAEDLARYPVDAIVDFAHADALLIYGEAIRQRGIRLVSAVSNYPPEQLAYLRELSREIPVMASPNITVGINFLMLASRLLRRIAPAADIAILEQHFRDKPEISGTAKKIAASLEMEDEEITSLRLGGIVGQHEVIFGFPHQTVRLIHNSIRREAFGTGAAFAVEQLMALPPGFYTYEQLLERIVREELERESIAPGAKSPCPDSANPPDQGCL